MPISKLKASSIASGTIDNARIPSLAASKIGSGTFDDARIAASNVSQHATSFDDNKLVNDLSTLGLRVHTQENLSASNTNSQYVDVFQDATGYTNGANTLRNSSEYVNSTVQTLGSESLKVDADDQSASSVESGTFDTNTVSAQNWTVVDDATHTRTTGHYNSDASRDQQTLWGIFAESGQNTNGAYNYFGQYTDTSSADVFYAWDTGASSPSWVITKCVWDRIWTSGTPDFTLSGSNDLTGSWTVLKHIVDLPSNGGKTGCDTGSFSNSTVYRYYQVKYHNIPTPCDVGLRSFKIYGKTFSESLNATGNFTCPNITAASATTKMGAVITYQDTSGTNALNTDIVLQLSADGGSNYSTATLTALPDFSTGIKMAKVNDLAVTSGTSLKYKISFANQASGSKEARIRGVSLNY